MSGFAAPPVPGDRREAAEGERARARAAPRRRDVRLRRHADPPRAPGRPDPRGLHLLRDPGRSGRTLPAREAARDAREGGARRRARSSGIGRFTFFGYPDNLSDADYSHVFGNLPATRRPSAGRSSAASRRSSIELIGDDRPDVVYYPWTGEINGDHWAVGDGRRAGARDAARPREARSRGSDTRSGRRARSGTSSSTCRTRSRTSFARSRSTGRSSPTATIVPVVRGLGAYRSLLLEPRRDVRRGVRRGLPPVRILHAVHNYPPEFRGGIERVVEALVRRRSRPGTRSPCSPDRRRRRRRPGCAARRTPACPCSASSAGPGLRDPIDPFRADLGGVDRPRPCGGRSRGAPRPPLVQPRAATSCGARRAAGFPPSSRCTTRTRRAASSSGCPMARRPAISRRAKGPASRASATASASTARRSGSA